MSGEAPSSFLVFVVLRVNGLLTSGDSWGTRVINHRADLGKDGRKPCTWCPLGNGRSDGGLLPLLAVLLPGHDAYKAGVVSAGPPCPLCQLPEHLFCQLQIT